ncbi:hypothetical protein [Kitasatospora cineracea]|uniref:Uncharacterized protein n=1 Tax=Kitasatospora cineracea TaxID=88074 RepID=A0A8G1XC42_9ACTN|nr:hypothetical protein [Kitasatospora cineracea]ROR37339.1 hypothetical protein EDD39_5475 [Kitasatospora cineracea]
MREFRLEADEQMQEFFSEVADVIQSFGASRAEAVARVNRAWGGRKIAPYPDLLCHEDPEYWAYGLYYDDADGDEVPYWDPSADRSTWTVVPPPPDGDPAWTLPRER